MGWYRVEAVVLDYPVLGELLLEERVWCELGACVREAIAQRVQMLQEEYGLPVEVLQHWEMSKEHRYHAACAVCELGADYECPMCGKWFCVQHYNVRRFWHTCGGKAVSL